MLTSLSRLLERVNGENNIESTRETEEIIRMLSEAEHSRKEHNEVWKDYM